MSHSKQQQKTHSPDKECVKVTLFDSKAVVLNPDTISK